MAVRRITAAHTPTPQRHLVSTIIPLTSRRVPEESGGARCPTCPPPSWILADSRPGLDAGTNDAMPRFGGRVQPGQSVELTIDGNGVGITPTADGSWTYAVPELDNGEHEFGMRVHDTTTGDSSPPITWTNDVQASPEDREWQRQRNQEWRRPGGGAEKFLDENDAIARTGRALRSSTGGGGGGGGQPPMTDPAPPSASNPGRTATGGGGSAGGGGTPTDGPGGNGPTAQGLEKGNSGAAIAR